MGSRRRSLGFRAVVSIGPAAVVLAFVSSCRPAIVPSTTVPTPPLRVGTSGDYAPFSSLKDGPLHGFDVDAAERLADDFGRPLVFVPLLWPNLVAQLRAHDFDVAMSGVTVRRDRALHVRFTRPYLVTGAVAVIRTADSGRFSSLDDLDHPHVRVLVNRGGHLERVTRRFLKKADVHTVDRNETLPALLSRGGGDAVISERFEVGAWDGDFTVLGPFTRDRKAYAVPIDAVELWKRLDEWLAAREADGFLNSLRRRWLGDAATRTPQASCFEAIAASVELRLSFMPLVAEAKRRDALPVEVPEQEARILEGVRAAAVEVDLHADDVVRIFGLLFGAAKALQRHTLASPARAAGETGDGGQPGLPDLRRGIAAASDAFLAELARCRPWLVSAPERATLAEVLRQGIAVPGQPADFVEKLVSALAVLRSGAEERTPSRDGAVG